jgi:hypothetical protein
MIIKVKVVAGCIRTEATVRFYRANQKIVRLELPGGLKTVANTELVCHCIKKDEPYRWRIR